MATKTRRASTALAPRRSSGGIAKARFEGLRQRMSASARRLRDARQEDTDAAAGLVTAVGLGLLERSGRKLPSVGGFDGAIIWGPVAWLAGRNMRGKQGGMLRQAGLMLTGIGASRAAVRGSLRVGEDDSADDDEFVADDL